MLDADAAFAIEAVRHDDRSIAHHSGAMRARLQECCTGVALPDTILSRIICYAINCPIHLNATILAHRTALWWR
jgi:hypothetical protein